MNIEVTKADIGVAVGTVPAIIGVIATALSSYFKSRSAARSAQERARGGLYHGYGLDRQHRQDGAGANCYRRAGEIAGRNAGPDRAVGGAPAHP